MSEYMDSLLHDEEKGFIVTDDQKAMWCIKKIKEARQEAKELLDHYEAQTAKVKEGLAADEQFFQDKLFQYFQTVPKKKTDTQQSYTLPGVKFMLKKQEPAFEPDADALLAYLKAAGRTGCIKVIPASEKPSWADYKPLTKVIDGKLYDAETGELVEAVKVTARPDKFEVKIDG
jgi:hypothetical protein